MREALENAATWLSELLSYPAAMKQVGPLVKDRAEGAVYWARKVLDKTKG